MDHLRTWAEGPFRLELYDTHRTDERGQTRLAYELHHCDSLIFDGRAFSGSPMHADDSDATVAGLLHFLALRPGDTDSEYFDGYTPEQLELAMQHGEELSLLAMELEASS